MVVQFVWSADSGIGKGLQIWYDELAENRGTRAMLRRCASLDEAVLSPAYQRFYRRMLGFGWPEKAENYQKDKLAAIAVLAAMLRNSETSDNNENVDKNLPDCMWDQ